MNLKLDFTDIGKHFKSLYPLKGENVLIIWTIVQLLSRDMFSLSHDTT